jgi:hypothetical protein
MMMMIIIIIIIIQFNSIIYYYVPSQQLQGQLQTQHSVDTSNYITDKYKKKQNIIKGKQWRKQYINAKK